MKHVLAGLFAILFAGIAAAETIDIGGVARTYLTQFPDTKPAPLVVVLHGNTQSGADMRTRTSWSLVANREKFAVIYPDGLSRAWGLYLAIIAAAVLAYGAWMKLQEDEAAD